MISLAGNYDYQTKLFNHTNFLSYDGNNFKEVFYKISGAEKVFSSRAHGAIIGLIFKKQTYVYTIDPKLINIFFGEETESIKDIKNEVSLVRIHQKIENLENPSYLGLKNLSIMLFYLK